MTASTLDPLWVVITAVFVASLAFRLSFFVLFSWVEEVPPRAAAVLKFVGPSVIAALVLPAVLMTDGTVSPLTPEFAAALVAAVVAWRTENIAATVGIGMAVLWTVEWLV